MPIYADVTQTVGNTPLVRLNRLMPSCPFVAGHRGRR